MFEGEKYMGLKRMVFCWLVFSVLSVIPVLVQSQIGFVNIDCGLSPNTSYVESFTKLTYVSDDQFIDTGVNYQVSSKYATNYDLYKPLLNVRSFPKGTRNCYMLKSLVPGSKYLIRASFMYGNYDNLNKPPSFDIHFGVNFWDTITTDNNKDDYTLYEIIGTAPADYIQVCLVNKGLGNPFISLLELRPLKNTVYPFANGSRYFNLYYRANVGSKTSFLRYPDDPYDRIWWNSTDPTWTKISTTSTVTTEAKFEVPSIVLQTAAIGSIASPTLELSWTTDDKSKIFLTVLHMAEIQNVPTTGLREFDIVLNDEIEFSRHVPFKFAADWAYFPGLGNNTYNMSLIRTTNSTLPPILNAYEIFIVLQMTLVPSDYDDVDAINTIKAYYKVDKGWNGDPCVPANLSWSGVSCTSNSSGSSRITGLNVSSSGLTGSMIAAFGSLTSLKKLDLSWNKLSGPMPIIMDQLTSLIYLDISGNSLTLSPGLQKKQENGLLTVINSNSPPPSTECTTNCNKKKSWIMVVIVVVVLLVLIAAAAITTILCLRKRKLNTNVNMPTNQNYGKAPPKNNNAGNYVPNPVRHSSERNSTNASQDGEGLQIFENRQFNHKELKMITNNFQNSVGTGGFGSVYVGRLENGTQVAVKIRSHSSSQGVKEFLAEAKNLTRVHHKHLVSLIGYCMDGDTMALVYEYMQEGTLQDKLTDNARTLTWKQRLHIAYQSALGLEYLHKSCNPPLIHRDVKTNNILLSSNLEAKIADFGLSRAFDINVSSHVSTAVVGTPGYLDPEYYTMYQLSEKSDVFSFGVVLLEIITGKPPIIGGPEGGHISQWVNQRLTRGDIESIVDPRMQGQYDINSVWKVTNLAIACTEHSSSRRPTMSMVAVELKESLELETSTEVNRTTTTSFTSQYTDEYNFSRNDNLVSDVSQTSTLEMSYMRKGMPEPGPSAR